MLLGGHGAYAGRMPETEVLGVTDARARAHIKHTHTAATQIHCRDTHAHAHARMHTRARARTHTQTHTHTHTHAGWKTASVADERERGLHGKEGNAGKKVAAADWRSVSWWQLIRAAESCLPHQEARGHGTDTYLPPLCTDPR